MHISAGTGKRSKPPLVLDNNCIFKILSNKKSVVFLNNSDDCCFSRAVTHLLFDYQIEKSEKDKVLKAFRRDTHSLRWDTAEETRKAYKSIKDLLRKINDLFQEVLDWQWGSPIEEHHYPAINSILKERLNSSLRVVTYRGNSIFRPPPSEGWKNELTVV